MNIMQLIAVLAILGIMVLSIIGFAYYLLRRVDRIEDRIFSKMMNEASATSKNKNCTKIGRDIKNSKINNSKDLSKNVSKNNNLEI